MDKRFRREVDAGTLSGEEPQNDEISSASGETYAQDDSSDNDIEVSPYTRIVQFDQSSEDDATRNSFRRPQGLGPHRPTGSIDPNGSPLPPSDLGPQRPSGQHPPSEGASVDLGPHRPMGSIDPNGTPVLPSDLGLQRPSGQHPPSEGVTVDLGPHRPMGSIDPNGPPVPPSDLGPQRPSGQHPPSAEDLGPQRPFGQRPPLTGDFGPLRPSGQHPESSLKIVLSDPIEGASQEVARSPSSDLGPHRPSGNTDPNGIPSSNLGPHRPSGATDPNGIPSPPTDVGPHRPSGQHPPEDLPKESLGDSAQTGVISHTPPSDLGSKNFSGSFVPNGIPPVPLDFGLQRPSLPPYGVDSSKFTVLPAPSVDLGPQRPSGNIDPNGPASGQGPEKPLGQLPSTQTLPIRVESLLPSSPIDLGPHRPAGLTDPNIKPGPDDQLQSQFNVYWNVPTFMCRKYGYSFENLTDEYGIVQNPNDEFRGPKVAILYDPGLFPALLQDDKVRSLSRHLLKSYLLGCCLGLSGSIPVY